jgi:hypothetical protein
VFLRNQRERKQDVEQGAFNVPWLYQSISRAFLGQILAHSFSQWWLTFENCRDIDQIISDLRSPKHLAQHKDSKLAEDLPGLGQWYCIECAKWFEGENSLVTHRRGKNHKRRSVLQYGLGLGAMY